jgi:predicted nucleotidyltransferase
MKQKVLILGEDKKRPLIEQLAAALQNRDEVMFAYIYGSFAEGLPFHDIDVGVYLSEITEEESTNYSLILGQMLSKELQVPVDIRVLNFAPVSFLYEVIRGNLIFERNEEIRIRVVEQTIQRYLDLKPMILRGIKEAFHK